MVVAVDCGCGCHDWCFVVTGGDGVVIVVVVLFLFCFFSMLCCGCQNRVVVVAGGGGCDWYYGCFLGSGIYYFIQPVIKIIKSLISLSVTPSPASTSPAQADPSLH